MAIPDQFIFATSERSQPNRLELLLWPIRSMIRQYERQGVPGTIGVRLKLLENHVFRNSPYMGLL
jgi:hypothetical protein